MDPVTTAILAALPALAGDVVKEGVRDAYDGLKAVIRRKWGAGAPIDKALRALEDDPESQAQAAVLQEKVGATDAADDPEVAAALHRLVEELKAAGLGGAPVANITVNISGGHVKGVTGAGTVSIGTMSFGADPKD